MMKVLNDRVLIRRLEDPPTSGLIVQLPNAARSQHGEVVTVGKKAHALKAGDQIVFGKYVGDDVSIDGVEHVILRESDVFGVLCPP
jgi:chaperonin GroES